MEKPWKTYAPALCGSAGALLLAGAVWACMGLERGGRADHITMAAALLILAELALLLLRREGCRWDTLLMMLLPIGAAMLARRYRVQLDYYERALTQLTGKKVKERVIYSLALQQGIEV